MATLMAGIFGRPMCLMKSISNLSASKHRVQQTCRSVASCSSISAFQNQFTQHATLHNKLCLLPTCKSSLLRQPERLCSALIPSLYPSNSPDVIDAVSSEVSQGHGRLFAVVYVAGQQHKVTTGDLILLQNHIPADVGERIRLEKVLLVGGDNYTLIGKPLLSLDTVRIEATVIEKTISEKKVVFRFKKRKRAARYKEKFTDLSVLRINSIEVSPKLT